MTHKGGIFLLKYLLGKFGHMVNIIKMKNEKYIFIKSYLHQIQPRHVSMCDLVCSYGLQTLFLYVIDRCPHALSWSYTNVYGDGDGDALRRAMTSVCS